MTNFEWRFPGTRHSALRRGLRFIGLGLVYFEQNSLHSFETISSAYTFASKANPDATNPVSRRTLEFMVSSFLHLQSLSTVRGQGPRPAGVRQVLPASAPA